ncbi:nucleoside-diphosphate sugar epimerase [Candidatus Micrarchaeota archaeon CG06_land_8_20_14_3_00_50_6]|nr:MAG: nucleoside-diphosphate sugar epimerase [Candidatus Micrarchaeota archaeon CG06_land_8_20_14_3_00_50_6]
MVYIVTGGAGFIGSNLVRKIASGGNAVIVIDNLHTGNEKNLEGIDNVTFVKGDASEILKIREDVSGVFHQGVYSSSPMYKENPLLVGEAVKQFTSVLEFCRKKDCGLVFASTSSLYNGIAPPHREDAKLGICDYYSEARICMERMAALYGKLHGMRVAGMRYFSVYGPHEEHKGKYANLLTQFLIGALKGEEPVVYGDGSQQRDFTYVDDVVSANMLAMDNGANGAFNVGTGKTYAINEMIALLGEAVGRKITPKYIENPVKNYVGITLADTSKAKTELGFEAKVSLKEGIGKIYGYYSKL